jgi:ABC-type polysaccharide transport system permease subunit
METTKSGLIVYGEAAKEKTRSLIWRRIRKNWQLYVMLALPMVWLLVFCYYPMYGAQIAFRNFLPGDSMWGAPWVGLDNFRRFIESSLFVPLMRNTIGLSMYTILAGFPIPIVFALMLNQLRNTFFRKSVQMVSYAPHFISTVVLVGIMLLFLSNRNSPVNLAIRTLGLPPIHFLNEPSLFQTIYVWSGVWQETGFSTVIYVAALATIDPELHEAAIVDGANRLQRIRYIDIPGIMPTVVVMLILNFGSIANVGFEKVYMMQNSLNLGVAEVISTYVFKIGLLGSLTNFSYAAAIGLFNSVINLALLVIANQLLKKVMHTSLW